MVFCFFYGAAYSLFAPYNVLAFFVPPVVLTLLVIWVLPDLEPPVRTLEWLFFAFFVANVTWPDYLAIALPGLPWITLARLTCYPLDMILLVCLSTSSDFRNQLRGSLMAISPITILLLLFVVIELISIGLSSEMVFSFQQFIASLTTQAAIFVASAYLFLRPGRVERWAAALCLMAVFVSLIAIWESRLQHLPWLGHIPSFLKIDDPAVLRILSPELRPGIDKYRVLSVFSSPLSLAEYIALTFPFVLHFLSSRYGRWTRGAAAASIPLLLSVVVLTDAKLGTISCFITMLLWVLITAVRTWRKNKNSILASAILYSYPVLFCMVIGVVLASYRLRVQLFGGGEHEDSTGARVQQFSMAIPKIMARPFGYGVGMDNVTLGFGKNIGGMLTIDSYYVSIALEFGVIGFLVYFGMFAIAIFESGRRGVTAQTADPEQAFLIPITLALIAFALIDSVLSLQDIHPVVFMMLGILMALAFRGDEKKVVAWKKRDRPLAGSPLVAAFRSRSDSGMPKQVH
jgi:hypothetical protein